MQSEHHDVEIAKEEGPTFKQGNNENKWAILNAQGFTHNLYSQQPTPNSQTNTQATFIGLPGLVWAGGTLRLAHSTFEVLNLEIAKFREKCKISRYLKS